MPPRRRVSACSVAKAEGYYHRPRPWASPTVHEKEIEIRWRDMDAYGHVNNAVYLTYLEEVRDEWLTLALESAGSAWDYVLARIEVDFRRELTQGDERVLARCRLESLGRSSLRTREELLTADGELAAESLAVLVARDRESRRTRPLTERERTALENA
jgi:acyl-CoA thioester hydrolase